MKPPMRQQVTVKTPALDGQGNPVTDDYGKPQLDSQTTKARVQHSTKLVTDQQGQEFQTMLEVDLPPDVPITYGTEITYTDLMGQTSTGKVRTMEESTNLAGSKVFFRTVNIG